MCENDDFMDEESLKALHEAQQQPSGPLIPAEAVNQDWWREVMPGEKPNGWRIDFTRYVIFSPEMEEYWL